MCLKFTPRFWDPRAAGKPCISLGLMCTICQNQRGKQQLFSFWVGLPYCWCSWIGLQKWKSCSSLKSMVFNQQVFLIPTVKQRIHCFQGLQRLPLLLHMTALKGRSRGAIPLSKQPDTEQHLQTPDFKLVGGTVTAIPGFSMAQNSALHWSGGLALKTQDIDENLVSLWSKRDA